MPRKSTKKEGEKDRKKIVVVDISETVDTASREAGEEVLTAPHEDFSGVRGWLRKLWKHNSIAEEYKRLRKIGQVRKQIKETGNIYAGEAGSEAEAYEAKDAIVERFISEYEAETVHTAAGEKKVVIGSEEESEAMMEIKQEIRALISRFVNDDTFTERDFIEEKNRILAKLRREQKQVLDGGKVYADNLLEIAENLKASLGHEEGLERLDEELDEIVNYELVLGKAKTGARTEAELGALGRLAKTVIGEKWARKFSEGRGLLIPEIAVPAGVAVALSIAEKAGVGLMRSKITKFATFGASALVAGGLVAMRESRKLRAEKRHHTRQRAEGKEIGPNSPHREEMEQFTYQMRSANELADNLQGVLYQEDEEGKLETKKDLGLAEVDAALRQLAEIEARIRFSDSREVDLISYSDSRKVERERLRLDIARAKAKVDIKKILTELVDSGKIDLGDQTVDEYVFVQLEEYKKEVLKTGAGAEAGLEEQVEAKDRAFNKMKTKKAAWAFVKGAIIGVGVGAAVQEVGAFFSSNKEGLVEHALKGVWRFFGGEAAPMGPEAHYTALGSLVKYLGGEPTHMDMAMAHEAIINGGHMSLPDGVDLTVNPDGSFNLVQGDQVLAEHLTANADGSLTAQTQEILGQKGILAAETHQSIMGTTQESVSVGPRDYINEHEDLFSRVHRRFWYDNNTPTIFDKNELKLWWGGVNGTGLDAQGNYVFNIKHMMPDGSYHGDFSVDAQEAMRLGKIKMILSASKETSGQVVEANVAPNGDIIIDKDSWAGKMLFKGDGQHAVFTGRYAEVVQDLGVKDGVEQVAPLATHEGAGLGSLVETVEVPKAIDEVHNVFQIPLPEHEVDLPPVIPIWAREPLEPMVKKVETIYPLYPRISLQREKEMRADMSPRLRKNPEAKLDPRQEIDWYFEDQRRRYPGYVEELTTLSQQETEGMNEATEAVVALAVAGHQEYNNIYRTLETYAVQQTREGDSVWRDRKHPKYEVIIYVNWPEGSSPEKTLKEIERFKKDHPEVPVRVFQEELKKDEVKVGWIKKKVFDLALLRRKERGDGADLLIIANDADNVYTSPTYLENVVETMNGPEGENYDALLGRQDLDPEVYRDNPTFHAVMRFWQFMEGIMRHESQMVGTQGRNTVMRSSVYAAIGGNREAEFWADLEFGQLIHLARGENPTIGYSDTAWVMVDPRREIDKFKKGEPVALTWADFNERQNVRGASLHRDIENVDLLALSEAAEDDDLVKKFKKRLEEEIQLIIGIFGPRVNALDYSDRSQMAPQLDQALRVIKKAGIFLGVKFDFSLEKDGAIKIKIADSSVLRRGLLTYQTGDRYQTMIKGNPLFGRPKAPAKI